MRKIVTVHDVARAAEVSTATVSRALNGLPYVRPELRERVRRAAEQLGYHPSKVARELRTGSTRLLGLLVTDIANPFFAAVARGIEDVAWRHGYSVILCDSDEDPAREESAVRTLVEHRVCGATVVPTHEDLAGPWRLLLDNGIAVVVMDRKLPGLSVDTVLVDNAAGTRQAVDHLAGLGHRRIGFVGGLPHTTTMRERRQAFESALCGHGIESDGDLVRSGDSKLRGGREAALALLALDPPPTALFVANHLMVLGALNAIRERGLSVPGDISVIGFDDPPWAPFLDPPLTAVSQPADELGRAAAQAMVGRLGDPSRKATEMRLQPHLVVRQSCARPGLT